MLDSNSAIQLCPYCTRNAELKYCLIQAMRPSNSAFDSLYCNLLPELNFEELRGKQPIHQGVMHKKTL